MTKLVSLEIKSSEIRSLVQNLKPHSMIIVQPAKNEGRLHKQSYQEFIYQKRKTSLH